MSELERFSNWLLEEKAKTADLIEDDPSGWEVAMFRRWLREIMITERWVKSYLNKDDNGNETGV
jgi:hypothetical protein